MNVEIIEKIRELNNLLCKSIRIWEKKSTINGTQFQIIMYLIKHEDEEICQKDLENETHLKKASITGTLDSLEDKDIIVRKPSDSDKRRNVITLSERVKSNVALVKDKVYELENTLQKSIKKEDVEIFNRTLDMMINNIKNSK